MPAPRRSSQREASNSLAAAEHDAPPPLSEAASPPPLSPAKPGLASVAIDLGSYSIRVCIASPNTPPIVTRCPNALVRTSQKRHLGASSGSLVGPQILQRCTNYGSLSVRQPMDRGMIVDWPTQKMVLDAALMDALSREKTSSSKDQRLLEGRDVILTEAYLNLPDLQAGLDLLLLEEYGAAKIWRCNPALTIPYQPTLFSSGAPAMTNKKRSRPECMCIIDLGHNATHVVPVLDDSVIWKAVRRHIVSQRILTNLLKETLSFRQYDMMDEGWLVGHIKERCCFVAGSAGKRGDTLDIRDHSPSQWSYSSMMAMCAEVPRHKNPLVQEFVLPDYSPSSKEKLGYVKGEKGRERAKDLNNFIMGSGSASMSSMRKASARKGEGDEEDEEEDESDDDFREGSPNVPRPPKKKKKVAAAEVAVGEDEDMEQVLVLERERFQVPEAMFDPGIVGLDDAPLHRVVEACIGACEEELQGPLWANIVLVGGGAKMQGLKERLYNELRPLAPADGPLQLWMADDPSLSALEGAQSLLVDSSRLLRTRFVAASDYSPQVSRDSFGSWSGVSSMPS